MAHPRCGSFRWRLSPEGLSQRLLLANCYCGTQIYASNVFYCQLRRSPCGFEPARLLQRDGLLTGTSPALRTFLWMRDVRYLYPCRPSTVDGQDTVPPVRRVRLSVCNTRRYAMLRIQRLLLIFSALTALALLAGCGSNTTANQTGLSTSTPEPSSSSATKPSPTTSGNSTAAARTGPVTLHVDAQYYRKGDTISVTLSNQSNQTIYFPDHLTNCTVILLQRLKVQPLAGDDVQVIFDPCRLAIATRIHSLDAGQHLVERLVASPSGWVPGLYYATLSYRTSLDAGSSTTIKSGVFTVGPLVPQEP